MSAIAQMHAALTAAERVLADMDTLLKSKHPGLTTMPELVLVRSALAKFAGDGA